MILVVTISNSVSMRPVLLKMAIPNLGHNWHMCTWQRSYPYLWFLEAWVMWPSRLLVQLGFCFLVATPVHQGTVLSRPQMTSPDEFSIYKLRGGKRERLVNKSLTVLGLKQQQGFTSHVEESKSVKQLNSEPVKMLKTPTSCQWRPFPRPGEWACHYSPGRLRGWYAQS